MIWGFGAKKKRAEDPVFAIDVFGGTVDPNATIALTSQAAFSNDELLRDEYGFEAFYNFASTPWALLTPDIQIIRGAQKDQVTIG